MPKSSNLLIKDLPASNKPREKLVLLGPKNLTTQELIAILLHTGTRQKSVLQLSQELISKRQLKDLFQFSQKKLCKFSGIGPAKAATLLACFELAQRYQQQSQLVALNNPEKVFQQAYSIKDKKQEICLVMYVDGSQRLLLKKTLAIGSLNQNFLEFRELLKPALTLPAAGFILVHNHPSGNAVPSEQDLTVTKQVAKGANLVGVQLIDHVIVTHDNFFSLKKAGLGEW
jgi:DNA repair protein RadC